MEIAMNTNNEISRIAQAFELAERLHRPQSRKTDPHDVNAPKIPYVTHLVDVMSLVLQAQGDEDQAIAALLHDLFEDVPEYEGIDTREIVATQFGSEVVRLVEICTDGDANMERTPETWRPRKEHHLAQMRNLVGNGLHSLLVPLADKLANGQSIIQDGRVVGERVWSRFNAPKADVLWYYSAMRDVFIEAFGVDHSLVRRLVHVVDEMHEGWPSVQI
jgi:(p)ppGpp synthase/HD superfamily hydrolase